MIARALLAVALLCSGAFAQEWSPAPGPLMTRWGKAVTPDNVHPEYPRPTLVRMEWQNLNGLWQFAPAAEGEAPPFGRDLPERILVPFPVESSLSGIGRHEPRMWYRRAFEVPAEWRGRRAILHLDAVDWEAAVYVNGKQVGTHRGGFDRFSIDITDAINPSGPQELIVGVWDPTDEHWQPRGKQVLKPGGIWYTPTSGIWQTVWMEPVNETHVRDLVVTADSARSSVRVRMNWNDIPFPVEIVVSQGQSLIATATRGRGEQEVEIAIPDPHFWTPDNPFLYSLQISIHTGHAEIMHIIDSVATQFAFRSVEVKPDAAGVRRVHFNDQPAFLVGPLDQGFWPDGLYTPPSDDAIRFDIETMKRLGFNAVRKHVKIESERWYYWCDRLGLAVLQDMPSGDRYIGGADPDITRTPDSAAQFEVELRRLIEDRGRHPSVIGWVVFNEGWGQSDTERNTKLVQQLDPARLVISASGWTDRGTGDIFDIHTYPGPGPIGSDRQWGGRAVILGEFGGLGLAIDGHTWESRTWGYKGASDRDDLTGQYVELLRRLWALKDDGLSAGIYTQLTDVETECNGLLTYDREVLKVDADRVARANRGLFPRIEPVLAASQIDGATWRHTFAAPDDGWEAPGFDDSSWIAAPAGFGSRGTPGAIVRTGWTTPDIWLRRGFELSAAPAGDLALLIHHDEDAEVWLNGVLAAKVTGYTTDYTIVPVRSDAAGALKPGPNTIAVHCRQTRGGQYIDVGIVRMIEREE